MIGIHLMFNFTDMYTGGGLPTRQWVHRLDPIEKVTDMEMYVPWFLACNTERFPYWFGREEPRNKDLQEILQEFFRGYNSTLRKGPN